MMAYSALHVAVALVPVAAYCLLMGWIHCGRRPFVLTGTRDAAALGIALIGFVAVGPMELFMPSTAANQFGPYVWLLLLALYLLTLFLIVLILPPRLMIYNATLDQLRPVLADAVFSLDADARWAGECLCMPNAGIQLHISASPAFRLVQLTAVGGRQDFTGWRRLERALAERLRDQSGPRRAWGGVLILAALVLLGLALFGVARDPSAVADSLRQTLRW
ncbi:MAG: hypothetical protein FJ297_12760 [Planctomycetes bacterium]|nr:hypothetical protein [Planctomycetota bacterium]